MARKYALLIGNDSYEDKFFGPLTVPSADVEALRRVLLDPAIGGFTSVRVLLNSSSPTASTEIGDLFADKLGDDLVLLYFSGHGALDADGHLYLALGKSRHDRLTSTGLWSNQIKKEMDNSLSRRQVLILDCCYSGAFDRGGKDANSGIGVRAVNKATFEVNGYGREILTSSSATQRLWEGNQVIGDTDKSVFTHYLVEGLKSGDAAPEGNKAITVDQLYQYVHAKVVKAGARMTPQRWADRLEGPLVIAKNPRSVDKPKALPENLVCDIQDAPAQRRLDAVNELARIARGDDAALALSAQKALKAKSRKELDIIILEIIDNVLEEAENSTSKPTTRQKPDPLSGSNNVIDNAQSPKKRKTYANQPTSINEEKPTNNRPIANKIEAYRYPIIVGSALILLVVAGYREKFLETNRESLGSQDQQITRAKKDKKIVRSEKDTPAVKTAPSRAPEAFSVFRDTLKNGSKGPEMVVIPADRFKMGSPESEVDRSEDEGPRHTVRIAKSFALGKHEISVDEFGAFVNDIGLLPESQPGCYSWNQSEWKLNKAKNWRDPGFEQSGDHPVVCISSYDAKDYAAWLSTQTGKEYRLPSEAEWEYAARAGMTSARLWGDNPDEACAFANVANQAAQQTFADWEIHTCPDGYVYTAPVGNFKENKFKLKDMLGNVWEWIEDCWHGNYEGAPNNGSTWLDDGDCTWRVIRGGAWNTEPRLVRSATRGRFKLSSRLNYVGFRLAQDL